MRLGIFTGGAGESTPIDGLMHMAVQAEQDGFDSFWLPSLPSRNYDALMVMALAGRATTRIELGTGVVPTYPRHPLVMAQQALTAQAAGRPQPRVCVGLPVAVTHDKAAGRQAAASIYQRYGQLTNYRRMLDLEGAAGPEDVAIVGDEAEVTRQLRAFADAGATDFLASLFPVGNDGEATKRRTWECLKSVLGTV